MATKEVGFVVDLAELDKQLEQRRKEDELQASDFEVRSTVFSLGRDPRVSIQQQLSIPNLFLLEILKDGLKNPYVEIHWRLPRFDVDAGGIIGFNVFRRRLTPEDLAQSEREFNRKFRTFSRTAFDRVSRNTIKKGKFSYDKKALYSIRRSLVPNDILNQNLSLATSRDLSRAYNTFGVKQPQTKFPSSAIGGGGPFAQGGFEEFLRSKRFVKVGYVDYSKFLATEKQKFVFSKEREHVDLSYRDKKVGYGEVFEYYVTAITKDYQESPRSNSIKVFIEDLTSIRPPRFLTIKQLNENEIQLNVCMDSRDDVGRVLIYRKLDTDIFFKRIASVPNVSDCVSIVDGTVRYGKSYTYRVFLENIFGTLSLPKEIKIYSSVQKITPQSRSNNLKIPIVTAIQDQNSDNIKITMSSNDPLVSFYVLDRRNLTTHEKKFTKPGLQENGYGGDGWESNKFFVQQRRALTGELVDNKSVLRKTTVSKEIVFVDNTVMPGHVYQYRVRGSDLFNNVSSYAFATVKVTGKKLLRTPINLKSEILRGYPFRIKLSWADDNVTSPIFSSGSLYRLQRRKQGETVYESFPLTENKFVVDEIASLDTVDFQANKTDDIVVKSPNIEAEDGAVKISGDAQIRRPFGVPDFLQENSLYYYRVAAVAPNKIDESNYSQEFEVSSIPDLSDPINLKTEVLNTRIRPLVARISWSIEKTKAKADFYLIERKFDSINDTFSTVGKAYLDMEFFDRSVELGRRYIYRVKAIDVLGRESRFFEVRLQL